ncbi:MAG: ribokinase, partial [Lentisphaerae bacterium]|nr:ribokinase [Lentisphaerota bacterium]
VAHAGRIGRDGLWLRERLQGEGVDVSGVLETEAPTGHAIIQVDPSGETAIVLHGGANQCVTPADADCVLASFNAGDYLLVQNEISALPAIIRAGAQRGLRVVFNPAPLTPAVHSYPLDQVSIFILNETEAQGLTGVSQAQQIGAAMAQKFPEATTVVTLGHKGSLLFDPAATFHQPAEKVTAVDTTAAGDTFIGFFLSHLIASGDARQALQWGCRAAAVCVTRPGAADSIPHLAELEKD